MFTVQRNLKEPHLHFIGIRKKGREGGREEGREERRKERRKEGRKEENIKPKVLNSHLASQSATKYLLSTHCVASSEEGKHSPCLLGILVAFMHVFGGG